MLSLPWQSTTLPALFAASRMAGRLAGETATILREAGFRSIAATDKTEAIIDVLDRFIPEVRNDTAYVASDAVIARSTRTHKSGELASLFDEANR